MGRKCEGRIMIETKRKVRILVKLKHRQSPMEIVYLSRHGLLAAIRQEVNLKVTAKWKFSDIDSIQWEVVG